MENVSLRLGEKRLATVLVELDTMEVLHEYLIFRQGTVPSNNVVIIGVYPSAALFAII